MTEPTQVWPPEPGGAGRDQTTRAGLLGGAGAIHGERAPYSTNALSRGARRSDRPKQHRINRLRYRRTDARKLR
jgi:hypothetical protein